MLQRRLSFKKKERLKSRRIIKELFSDGKSKSFFPIRLVWMKCELPAPSPAQISTTVPKSKFNNAVDRYLLKRRMKEAFRLNKFLLYDSLKEDEQLAIMILYTSREKESFELIEASLIKGLKYLTNHVE